MDDDKAHAIYGILSLKIAVLIDDYGFVHYHGNGDEGLQNVFVLTSEGFDLLGWSTTLRKLNRQRNVERN